MGYKTNDEERKVCLECGAEIYGGRAGRKFCNEQCKNRFHNNETRKYTVIKSKVFYGITLNYAILERLVKSGTDSISLDVLDSMGFNRKLVTGTREGVHRHKEYTCLDIKYYQSPTRIFNIRKVDMTTVL